MGCSVTSEAVSERSGSSCTGRVALQVFEPQVPEPHTRALLVCAGGVEPPPPPPHAASSVVRTTARDRTDRHGECVRFMGTSRKEEAEASRDVAPLPPVAGVCAEGARRGRVFSARCASDAASEPPWDGRRSRPLRWSVLAPVVAPVLDQPVWIDATSLFLSDLTLATPLGQTLPEPSVTAPLPPSLRGALADGGDPLATWWRPATDLLRRRSTSPVRALGWGYRSASDNGGSGEPVGHAILMLKGIVLVRVVGIAAA